MKALLKKIAKADPAGGGNNLRAGKGILVVDRIVIKDGYKGLSYRIEGVIESSKQTMPDTEPNAPGSRVSIVDNFKNEGAEGRLLAAILAIADESASLTEAQREELLSKTVQEDGDPEPSLVKGRAVAFETVRLTTKKGQTIDAPRWSAVKQTDEDVTNRVKFLESL